MNHKKIKIKLDILKSFVLRKKNTKIIKRLAGDSNKGLAKGIYKKKTYNSIL